MKKIMCLAAIAAATLCFTGCEKKSESEQLKDDAAKAAQQAQDKAADAAKSAQKAAGNAVDSLKKALK